ncbi:Translation machinery-associated protein 20 [Mycena kentingensis (nom. inval.)]|nr:Translation machinery-associated protein 20 [Mycena kentingensis (nom. inval.)]
MSFRYDNFTKVTRKNRKTKGQAERPPLISLVRKAAEDLRQDDWNASWQRLLHDRIQTLPERPCKLICLGLGSPTESANSRAQLAFLLEICGAVPIEHANVALYDPVFSQEDETLFGELGMRLLADNKDGSYPLDAPTILWMPHCDLELYENVLSANWSHDKLAFMTLIANRLGDYVDSNPMARLQKRAPRLVRIADVLECRPLPAPSAWTTAFNTIAIQWVAEASVSDLFELPETHSSADEGPEVDTNIQDVHSIPR